MQELLKEKFILQGGLFSHHASLIEGDRDAVLTSLLALFKEEGVRVEANPDLFVNDYVSFGIDESRVIKEMQSRKTFDRKQQIFVLSFSFISHEAQNSLLKVLEEPTAKTFFFIIVPHAGIFLPTILSRMQLISLNMGWKDENARAQEFLSKNVRERLLMLYGIIEEKDKEKAVSFASALLATLHKKHLSHKNALSREGAAQLTDIEKCREYLYDRGAGVKMICEHLALTVPRQS